MEGDTGVQDILEALKYTTSDSLKATQRKFAAARNTIMDEALAHRYKAFFSPEEQEALQKAAHILSNFKSKIEHAKEIRAREEKLREAHLNRCKALRAKLLEEYLTFTNSIDKHLEAVIFHLALQDNANAIAKGAYFGHGIGYIETDLARGLDAKYPHLNVKMVAQTCWMETRRWLDENLWRHNLEPERSRMDTVLKAYRDEWRNAVLEQYKKFLGEYELALRGEFDRDASSVRAAQAKTRRAGIKIIK